MTYVISENYFDFFLLHSYNFLHLYHNFLNVSTLLHLVDKAHTVINTILFMVLCYIPGYVIAKYILILITYTSQTYALCRLSRCFR